MKLTLIIMTKNWRIARRWSNGQSYTARNLNLSSTRRSMTVCLLNSYRATPISSNHQLTWKISLSCKTSRSSKTPRTEGLSSGSLKWSESSSPTSSKHTSTKASKLTTWSLSLTNFANTWKSYQISRLILSMEETIQSSRPMSRKFGKLLPKSIRSCMRKRKKQK